MVRPMATRQIGNGYSRGDVPSVRDFFRDRGNFYARSQTLVIAICRAANIAREISASLLAADAEILIVFYVLVFGLFHYRFAGHLRPLKQRRSSIALPNASIGRRACRRPSPLPIVDIQRRVSDILLPIPLHSFLVIRLC